MQIKSRWGMSYAAVEDVKAALDILETARAESQIRRVLRSATDSVEGLLRRRFYPEVRSQTFRWYDELGATDMPWTVWFDANEIISVTAFTTGQDDTAIAAGAGGYLLKPDDGPPYTRVELDTEGSATFETRSAYQDSVTISGLFGYWNEYEDAGILDGLITDSATTLDVSNGALVGIGNLLKIGTERVVVTGRSFKTITQTLTTGVSLASTTSIPVVSGAAFNEGELILVDSERMLIVDVAGNNLIVKRGWDGSTLEAHLTGATVYVSRTLTVTRGALGTTAAAHSDDAPVSLFYVPPLVQDLCIAEAMAQLLQERTAYARTIGAGEGEREVRGTGLADLRKRAVEAYGRKKSGRAA
jgi:hypothetical protein